MYNINCYEKDRNNRGNYIHILLMENVFVYTERNFRLNLDPTDKNFYTETNIGS